MGAEASIAIRAARRGDAELLLELIRELATYEKLAHEVVGDAAQLERSLFDLGAAEALIAEAGGEAAGYAIFFTTFSTFECRPGIWLEDVYVRPAFRRRGIGLALLARLAETALERDFVRLEWTALNWNEPALEFYAGLGARRMEEWQTLRLEGEGLRELAAS